MEQPIFRDIVQKRGKYMTQRGKLPTKVYVSEADLKAINDERVEKAKDIETDHIREDMSKPLKPGDTVLGMTITLHEIHVA